MELMRKIGEFFKDLVTDCLLTAALFAYIYLALTVLSKIL